MAAARTGSPAPWWTTIWPTPTASPNSICNCTASTGRPGLRAINGPIDDLLFPINHGTLFYPGVDVLPAHVICHASQIDKTRFEAEAGRLRERMTMIAIEPPIAYRKQNFGDYRIPEMELLEGLERAGDTGFALHIRRP